MPALALLVTAGVVGVVFAHWGLETKQSLDTGIENFDSLWYHLPFSADMAQSGSTTGFYHPETVFLNWFYPQNSELFHTAGILLTGRDTLSFFINFGWLALTLVLAAVLFSYLNPVINFVHTYRATTAAKAELRSLQAENTKLHNRVQSADDPAVLEREARRQGMVLPGEHPYAVHGLHG